MAGNIQQNGLCPAMSWRSDDVTFLIIELYVKFPTVEWRIVIKS